MLDSAMLQRLLDVTAPWRVADCRLEPEQRLASVRIAPELERGLFKTREVRTVRELRWRHLDMLGWRVELTIALPPDTAAPDLPWCGETGQPFTRALAARVGTARRVGLDADGIARLLELPSDEVKLTLRLLDLTGNAPAARAAQPAPAAALGEAARLSVQSAADAVRAPQGSAPRAASVAAQAGAASVAEVAPVAASASVAAPIAAADATPAVPDAGSPVWGALVGGVIDIEIQQLGLKLLLNKLRAGVDELPLAERERRAGELHTYFGRNLRQLGPETLQLMRAARRQA
ncbi:hypothetical protein [Derxia gummosa]|uniref:Uncharacterized protein n=1 Tax=Derxia gummosa DSM 723 TaxID=1121388 RepID=A0A8B6XC97_9BURK|nr:hypothetical protein [Derxia gummosa]